MKVLHVIPNAFEYFTDIHSEAFKILEAEAEYGVEANAITIGYGGVTRKEAQTALRLAAAKLPLRTKFVDRVERV